VYIKDPVKEQGKKYEKINRCSKLALFANDFTDYRLEVKKNY